MVLFRRTMPVTDRFVSKITGGRHTLCGITVPTLILTHTGRQSGKHYETPLLYLPWNDKFVVVGSNWGQAHHPAWSTNLLAHPDVMVLVNGENVAVRARLASGEERQELWPLLVGSWPAFRDLRGPGVRSRDSGVHPRTARVMKVIVTGGNSGVGKATATAAGCGGTQRRDRLPVHGEGAARGGRDAR